MLTIEASHIYFGGGYTLLIQILDNLEKKGIFTKVYLAYQEVYNEIQQKKYSHIKLIKTNSQETILRYLKRRKNVLFFCNLPPFIKNKKSITYFHNVYFLERPQLHKKYIKEFIYFYWVKYFSRNTKVLACQTDFVKRKLNNYSKNVLILPFFETIKKKTRRKEFDFCYVGSAKPHKNYARLLDAIELLLKNSKFKVAVTVESNEENQPILKRISQINNKNNKVIITNFGLVAKKEVIDIYSKSKALVFPSLKESFGLPILEALMCDLVVLSSNLPFSYELIDNPIVFDPLNKHSIAQVMSDFLDGQYELISQHILVKNELNQLINIISS